MLLLVALAGVLCCFICCLTNVAVHEKKWKKRKPLNAVDPMVLNQNDPYGAMTDGEQSATGDELGITGKEKKV